MSFHALIIDDDLSFKKILEMRLKSFIPALVLEHFDTLDKARKHLKERASFRYDLVIIDEHLPDGRGQDFIAEKWFENQALISMSSDNSPDIPGAVVSAGANYFIPKTAVGEPLFRPLVQGIIERNRIQRQLDMAKIEGTILETVKTLVSTLRHEINNPLGAVLGAAYLLQKNSDASPELKQAAEMVENSGKRIKHVMEQLCQTAETQAVSKANHKVFHVPGDKPWGSEEE